MTTALVNESAVGRSPARELASASMTSESRQSRVGRPVCAAGDNMGRT